MYSQKQARLDRLPCHNGTLKRDSLMSNFNVVGIFSLQFLTKKIVKSNFRYSHFLSHKHCISISFAYPISLVCFHTTKLFILFRFFHGVISLLFL
ncbi:hypothetical protein Patl1_12296 [Pistacia atlantica]|uniref:Uncharacterized protein n=1 Tax=Pistacia atlantica TaxID=434234 RepID=A0ACC1AA59_9ROSI|nr:hypothetical protein Patl1_12296 [Pistacia atlantica]